jgi:hypothetical protein
MGPMMAIALAACDKQVEYRSLPICWNINSQATDHVKGKGVFIRSMEGLALVNPICDDRNGSNNFTVSFDSSLAIRDAIRSNSRSSYTTIWFDFEGEIEMIDGKKSIRIDKILHATFAERPAWMLELRKRHLGM